VVEGSPLIGQFNLVVTDMATSLAFYRVLGFDFGEIDPSSPGFHRSTTCANGFRLDLDIQEFAATWDEGWPSSSGGGMGVLGLDLPSRQAVDDLYDRVVTAGYRTQQVPYDAFFGARYAVVEDPDGNAVGLMSPIDRDRRGPAPFP
jgi:catechol 2,3-dioxygenase-like lactoylglutathione lyase family enzyme